MPIESQLRRADTWQWYTPADAYFIRRQSRSAAELILSKTSASNNRQLRREGVWHCLLVVKLTGMLQHEWTRTFFNDFLVPALYAALSLPEVDSVPQSIPKHLASDLERLSITGGIKGVPESRRAVREGSSVPETRHHA